MVEKVTAVMDVGSGRSIAFPIKKDVADYFGIETSEASAAPSKLIERVAYQFTREALTGEGTSKTITVGKAVYYATDKSSKGRFTGRGFLFPTNKTTQKGNLRSALIRIPSVATNMAVAMWVWTKFQAVANRPSFIWTPSRERMVIRNYQVTDVNPGNAPEAAAP